MTILDTIVRSKRLQFPHSGIAQKVPAVLGTAGCQPDSKSHKASGVLRFQESLLEHNRLNIDEPNQLVANAFVQCLKHDKISIIGEIKPSSPSAGKLLDQVRLPEILSLYKQHCSAISVLTDEEFFGGSLDLLTHVKQNTGLPVLCKDFIVSTEQITLANKHGADAVLLIVKILDQEELATLFYTALDQGLCPVVEINDISDLEAVSKLPVEVVLVNNRNLDTMQIDIETTSRLAKLLTENLIVISASGIKTKEDIEKLLPSSRRFLIGTSLMQSADPSTLLSELQSSTLSNHKTEALNSNQTTSLDADAIRRPSHELQDYVRCHPNHHSMTKVKICGITNSLDATMALEAGAEFIGLIFAPSSKRHVSVNDAAFIIAAVKGRASIVGVFQNQNLDEVNRIASELDLDFIQLHGEEDCNYMNACVRPVIKVFEYSSKQTVSHRQLLEFAQASYFLFDLNKTILPTESVDSIEGESKTPTDQTSKSFNIEGAMHASSGRSTNNAVLKQPKGACNERLRMNSNCQTIEENESDDFEVLAISLKAIRDRIPPFFLAGKLSPHNVQHAYETILPFAVDVASGVEEFTGKKSSSLTNQFCTLAKSTPIHTPQVVNNETGN